MQGTYGIQMSGHRVTLQERGVVVNGGTEIRTATIAPAGVMVTATHLRIQ